MRLSARIIQNLDGGGHPAARPHGCRASRTAATSQEAARARTRRALHVGGMLELPCSRRPAAPADRGATSGRSGSHRPQPTCRLLGPAGLEGSLLLERVHPPPGRVRAGDAAGTDLHASARDRREDASHRQRVVRRAAIARRGIAHAARRGFSDRRDTTVTCGCSDCRRRPRPARGCCQGRRGRLRRRCGGRSDHRSASRRERQEAAAPFGCHTLADEDRNAGKNRNGRRILAGRSSRSQLASRAPSCHRVSSGQPQRGTLLGAGTARIR